MPSRLWMMALVPVLVVTGLAPAVASADDRADRLAARQQRIAKERHKELLKRLYQAVHATSLDRTVVYFDQVKAGSQIWDERPARRPHAKQTRASVPLPHITNVYWIDQAWGQKFGHPTTLILEDTTTGLTAAKTLKFWPIVDGEPLPFVTWGRYDRRFQLYSDVADSDAQPLGSVGKAPTPAAARQAAAPIVAPKDSLNGDCIITIGEGSDVKAAADFPAVHQLAKDLAAAGTGIKSWRAANTVKKENDPDDPDGRDLRNNVRWMVNKQGCKDVMLFVDGHGTPKKDGPPAVFVGNKWTKTDEVDEKGNAIWESHPSYVTPQDIEAILNEFKTTATFKIKIDACFSGRFAPLLTKKRHPNLHIVEWSSAADEVSYFYKSTNRDKSGKLIKNYTNNPGNSGKPGLSEFTNGNLSALREFFTNRTLMNNARAVPGASLLAQALTYAARNSWLQDFAAQSGLTHPGYVTDQILAPPGGVVTGAVRTMGSKLDAPADTALSSPEDEDFWNTYLHYCEIHPEDPLCDHTSARQASTPPPTVPADGQILAIRVKGMAVAASGEGAPAPLTEIHFVLLRPQSDGSVLTIQSSQAFNLPAGGDPNQITEYRPENFCAHTGDYIALSTEGGFDPTWYPNGVSYQVFAGIPGSQVSFYTKHNGVMNGSQFSGTPRNDTELLMQWDLGTGDQATALCPGGTRQ